LRPKNKKVYTRPERGWDLEWLKATQEDYESLGFDTELNGDELTVFALPRRRRKKKGSKRG